MRRIRCVYVLMILLGLSGVCRGQDARLTVLSGTVTYVTPTVIYISGGKQDEFAVGDTLSVQRGSDSVGSAVITAVSRKSSAAQIIRQHIPFAVNDVAVIEKFVTIRTAPIVTLRDGAADSSANTSLTDVHSKPERTDNIVSGRVGLQYSGVMASDSRFNLDQPAATVRLDIQNVYATGMHFTMYGRTYYDLSRSYNRYGETSRLRNRVYEMQLRYEAPGAPVHFGAGRMTSAYVGGLGTFDGGFLYHRFGNITTGLLLGAKVKERTLGVDGDDKKGALFVNARFGSDIDQQYDVTVAYGKEMIESKLDREFIYLQNHIMLGPELSLYESTELELNEIQNGRREKALSLSNTYLSVNYVPVRWLTANAGYDGSRSIYLFESMKAISDTLIDKNLMHGYRGGLTFRLPYYMSVSGNISYRTRHGDERNSRTVSGTYRVSDIAGSDIGASARYADIVGVYSDGTNITADLDRMFFHSLSVALRYDYYSYRLISMGSSFITQTVTLSANYRFSRTLYSAMNLDKVYDTNLNSIRVYAEIGMRF